MDDSIGDDSSALAEPTIVDGWLEPLGEPPCGEDLEYDNAFLNLTQAAAGKPETQFAEAEPPDWRSVRSAAEDLFGRTRDLRVALFWARAMLAMEGALSLPDSLRLVHGLLDRFWDGLYPLPDDGDAYARVNALNDMCSGGGLLGDLRQSLIISSRAIGELRGRDVELALGRIEPREDESPPGRDQVEQMLRDAVAENPALANFAQQSIARLGRINDVMQERVGYGSAPDLQPLIDLLTAVQGLMPRPVAAYDDSAAFDSDTSFSGDVGGGDTNAGRRGSGLGDRIDTREDALRAIDMVCEYLERSEPTSPAQLLLRRAQRLVNKNFLELVRELAPESLNEVARIMGVSADDVSG
jgi:type VI secretion system protein ImpA